MSGDNVDMPALESEVLPGTEDVKPGLQGALEEAFSAIERNLGDGLDQLVSGVDPHGATRGASLASDGDVFEITPEEADFFNLLGPGEQALLRRIIIQAECIVRGTKRDCSAFRSINGDTGLWIKCAEDRLRRISEGGSPVTVQEGVTLPPHTGWYGRLLAN